MLALSDLLIRLHSVMLNVSLSVMTQTILSLSQPPEIPFV